MIDKKVEILLNVYDSKRSHALLKEYINWFRQCDVKYSFVYSPEWNVLPTSVMLSKENAMMFKLRFNL